MQIYLPALDTVVLVTVLGAVERFLITSFALRASMSKTINYVVSATANSAFDLSDLNYGTSLTNDSKSRDQPDNV